MPAKVIGDIGYVFRKKFGAQGWFMGTVVKIKKDGDRRCKYSNGDVEDLLSDDLVQLARLDTNSSNSTKRKRYILSKNLCRMSNVDQLQQRRRRRRRRRRRNAS